MKSLSRLAFLTGLCALCAIGCDPGPTPEEELELSTTSSAISRDFATRFVTEHNKVRERHGVQPVRWDSTLESQAQSWASRCTKSHSGTWFVGENWAAGWGGANSTPEQVVADWYDEVQDYDFNNPGFPRVSGRTIGHFTQVVWKDTSAIGCGYARCGNEDYFVCQYSAQGNIGGQYAQNVFPQGGGIGTGHKYTCSIRNGSGSVAGSVVVNKCSRAGDTTGFQMLNCDYVYNLFFSVQGRLHLEGHTSSMTAQIIDQASNQVAEQGRATFNDRENTFSVTFTTPGPKHQPYFTFPTYWDCRLN